MGQINVRSRCYSTLPLRVWINIARGRNEKDGPLFTSLTGSVVSPRSSFDGPFDNSSRRIGPETMENEKSEALAREESSE